MINKHTFYSKYGVGQTVDFNSWDLETLELLANTKYNLYLHYTAKIQKIKFEDSKFYYLCYLPSLDTTLWASEANLSISCLGELYRKLFPPKNRVKVQLGFDTEKIKNYRKFKVVDEDRHKGFLFQVSDNELIYWKRGVLGEDVFWEVNL